MLFRRILFVIALALLSVSAVASLQFFKGTIVQLAPIYDLPLFLTLVCIVLVFSIRKVSSTEFLVLLILEFTLLLYRNWDRGSWAEENDHSIRIVTLNVQQFRNDTSIVQSIVKQLNELDPDVVMLQEFGLYSKWPNVDAVASDFTHRIGMPYFHFKPESVDIFGVATFSKFPIESARVIFQSYPSTNEAYELVLIAGKQKFKIINFHLESFNLSPQNRADLRALFDSTLAKQEAQVAALIESAQSDIPTILAGDLNAVPGSNIYSELDSEFTNVQAAFGNGLSPTLKSTWLRLDHFWIDENSRVKGFEIWSAFPSDHRALMADVAL